MSRTAARGTFIPIQIARTQSAFPSDWPSKSWPAGVGGERVSERERASLARFPSNTNSIPPREQARARARTPVERETIAETESEYERERERER